MIGNLEIVEAVLIDIVELFSDPEDLLWMSINYLLGHLLIWDALKYFQTILKYSLHHPPHHHHHHFHHFNQHNSFPFWIPLMSLFDKASHYCSDHWSSSSQVPQPLQYSCEPD